MFWTSRNSIQNPGLYRHHFYRKIAAFSLSFKIKIYSFVLTLLRTREHENNLLNNDEIAKSKLQTLCKICRKFEFIMKCGDLFSNIVPNSIKFI